MVAAAALAAPVGQAAEIASGLSANEGAASLSGISARVVVLSRFALDGGAMHGIVPRPLWERVHVPDANNRIALVARALLVDHVPSGARTLIDVGLGQRWSDKERGIYAIEEGPDAHDVLAREGIDPASITHVLLTHLHWDHAGGLLRGRQGDARELAFPKAEHVVSRGAMRRAKSPSDKDAGSFRDDDLAHFLKKARIRESIPGEPLAPGVTADASSGHTDGLLVARVRARDDGPPLAFPTDLVPTRSHLKPSWIAAYDERPSISVDEKKALFAKLAEERGGVVFYHDPDAVVAWAREGAG